MIPSARPIDTPVASIVFCCFVFSRFEKWGRTYGQMDNMCENNDPVGRVDQYKTRVINDSLLELFCFIFKSGEGRTPRVRTVITTVRVCGGGPSGSISYSMFFMSMPYLTL